MHRFVLKAAVMACAALAQTPAIKFEVASVKPNHSSDFRQNRIEALPGGKLILNNLPLHIIIAAAYAVPFQSKRLTGGPDWIRADRYDIEAVAPAGSIPAGLTVRQRDELLHSMLRSLLAERFKLVVKSETKDLPVYEVTEGKHGVKLEKAAMEEKDCDDSKHRCHGFAGGQGRGLHSEAATVEDAAAFVSNWADRPVVDRTGLTSLYKFDTPGWVPLQPRPGMSAQSPEGLDDPLRPSLFGIFSQMGLKLAGGRAPIEMFTIVSVERPAEN